MKELKDYLKILSQNTLLIVVVVALAVFSAWVWTSQQKTQYQIAGTVLVTVPPEAKTQEYYSYDGYYAGLAAKEYTDVLVGLLNSPDLKKLVGGSAQEVAVEASKSAPQLIAFTATHPDENLVKEAFTRYLAESASRASQLNGDNFTVKAELVNPDPETVVLTPTLAINVLIALVGGVALSVLLIAVRRFFQT